MTNTKWTMTRRDWLAASSIVLGGLARPSASDSAEATAHSLRARLSLNENPFGPSPVAIEAVRSELGEICRYGNAGADLLTRAVVAREAVPADQIVFGEILGALGYHLATTGPSGGEFIYSEPGYTALVDAVAPGGGAVIGVPLNRQFENDLPAIAAKVGARTQGIYLVNPHNPSGTVSDAETFLNFVREMSKRTTVIVDEAYLEFEPDFDRRTAVGLTRAGENVIVFRTFAKIYGLAGLSVGYAVAPKVQAASLKRAGIGDPETLDRLAIAASTSSLQDVGYIAATRAKVATEREKWNRLFDVLKLRHSDSRGNFVFFETGRPHQEFAAALLARGIDIGRAFPPLERWARISIGLPRENELARETVAELLR
jgi:histidinol-phosphate aminotransferase